MSIHPLRLRVGRNVRRIRKAQGLTQEDLADLSRLHPTYIGGIERGERNLGIDNLGRLADALRVDVTVLVGPES